MNRILRGGLLTFCFGLAIPSAGTSAAVNLLDPTLNAPSFESPDVVFAENRMADVWRREGPGIFNPDNPLQTQPDLLGVGVFDNPTDNPDPNVVDGHLQNADGAQVAYIFSHSLPEGFPLSFTGTFSDHAVSQVTSLTYDAGKQYELRIAFANATSAASNVAVLTFSLFATNDPEATNGTVIASDTITSSELNQTSLVDFPILTPEIAGGIAGQFIGIRVSTHTEPADLFNSPGQFSFDNVRLTLVPEPSAAAMLMVGGIGLLSARRRH